jgi:hypothetical protein
MDPTPLEANVRRIAYALLAVLALANGGCLVAAGAAAAGAGVAGFAYAKGKVCHTFSAPFEETWAATRQSMTELKLPIVAEERETNVSGSIKSQASDGSSVRVYVEAETSDTPGQGPQTRVCVRAGTFGDYPISDRILSQVSTHVPTSPQGNGSASGGAAPNGAPLQPIPVTQAGAWSAAPPATGTPSITPPPPPPSTVPPTTAPPPLLPPDPKQ